MSGGFQTVVNQTLALGVVGDIFTNAPLIAGPGILVSANAANNVIGRAFTINTDAQVNPAPSNATQVVAGGTGLFFGILANTKTSPLFGTAGNPLAPSLLIPNNAIGEFIMEGEICVQLANPALIGDLVTYNQVTGELDSVSPTVSFTAAIAATAGGDVMTVSAISGDNGFLAPGQIVTGTGVAGGTTIAAYGTGFGGTGTYILNTINEQTVGSESMSVNAVPNEAASFTGVIAVTTGILTVSAITAGRVYIGMELKGTGVPAGTFVTGLGSGTGGNGTYQTNIATAVSSTTMTSDAFSFVPSASVSRFASPGNSSAGGGFPTLAIISLNNRAR